MLAAMTAVAQPSSAQVVVEFEDQFNTGGLDETK